jgi:hypothetical protein
LVLACDARYVGTTALSDPVSSPLTEITSFSPNPFRNNALLNFSLKQPGRVSLKVFNLKGQLVRELFCRFFPAGEQNFLWSAGSDLPGDLPAGIYLLKLTQGNTSAVRRVLKIN